MKINPRELKKFLVEARAHSYAASEGKVKSLVPKTTQLEYRRGKWFYRDIYDGEVRWKIVYQLAYGGGWIRGKFE